MIKVGIIGSTGYAGQELVRLLLQHKEAEIVWYGSRSYVDKKYADVFRNMFKLVEDKCLDDNMDALAEEADVIFTATPQGLCASIVNEEVLKKTKIIDLSADSIWALLRSFLWNVIPNLCASSRICCNTLKAGELRSMNIGYGSPTLYTSSILSARDIRVSLSVSPSSAKAS